MLKGVSEVSAAADVSGAADVTGAAEVLAAAEVTGKVELASAATEVTSAIVLPIILSSFPPEALAPAVKVMV